MKPRKESKEAEVMGAFPGADVVRGKDWNLEDKDGKSSHHELDTLATFSCMREPYLYHTG